MSGAAKKLKTVFYTGQGDKGASILGNRKVSKDDILFDALGTLDELNTWIGLCRVEAMKPSKFVYIASSLKDIQEGLFIAQAEVAALGMNQIPKIHINRDKTQHLEREIAKIDRKVPQLKKFIIPGGSELSARIELARTVSRRLERTLVAFSKKRKLDAPLLQHINRLSSFLFALSRLVDHRLNVKREHPSYNIDRP